MTIPPVSERFVEYFSLTTELPFREAISIPELLLKYYIKREGRFRRFITSELREHEGYKYLFFSVPYATTGEWQKVDVMVSPGKPLQITMWKNHPAIPQEFLRDLYEDIVVMVQLIEEKFRQMSYYSIFVEGMPPLTKASGGSPGDILTDSQTRFFILMIVVNFLLFFLFGDYAFFITFGFIFLISVFSGRLMTRGKPWEITRDNQFVYLVQIALVWEEYKQYAPSYQQHRVAINKAIYESTIAQGKPVTSEGVFKIFLQHGIELPSAAVIVREINLYAIIEHVAQKFQIPIPRVVLTPTMIPNAAASGPNSRLGVIIITGGLLFQLTQEELISIIGHEMSHLKAHDPLVLTTMTVGMLLPLYFGFFPINNLFMFFLYYWGITSVTYLIGKFLEARCDLDSALKLQDSKSLANGLRKIGFIRLLPLTLRSTGRQRSRIAWFHSDPHPPLEYRIERLEKMPLDREIKHTFTQSVKDVLSAIVSGS